MAGFHRSTDEISSATVPRGLLSIGGTGGNVTGAATLELGGAARGRARRWSAVDEKELRVVGGWLLGAGD